MELQLDFHNSSTKNMNNLCKNTDVFVFYLCKCATYKHTDSLASVNFVLGSMSNFQQLAKFSTTKNDDDNNNNEANTIKNVLHMNNLSWSQKRKPAVNSSQATNNWQMESLFWCMILCLDVLNLIYLKFMSVDFLQRLSSQRTKHTVG